MDKKIQEKLYLYQFLKKQEEALLNQAVLIEQEIENSLITENVVKELENQKGKDILVSLGKDCFLRTEVKDDKILLNLGAEVLAKKSVADAKKILEERRKNLTKEKEGLNQKLEKIAEQIKKVEPEIQKILTQKS